MQMVKTSRVATFLNYTKRRVHNMQPAHTRIAKGMAWVTLFVFIGKLVGAAKEMAIAYRYGVSETVDAYIFAFTLVTWLPVVWQSVLTVVLVPIFAPLSEPEKRTFFAELMGFTLLAGGVLTLVTAVGLPALMPRLLVGFSTQAASQAIVLVRGLAPVAAAGILVGLLFARLLAEERHANTMMESLPALCILVAVLAWPDNTGIGFPGINPLLYGTIIGFVMYVAALLLLLTSAGISSRPRWSMHSPAWRAMWRGVGYMALGQIIISFANPIDQVMAAQLGAGAIATLGYANRVLALILGLGATAVGRAILPVLSEAVSQPRNAWHIARRWSQLLLIIGFFGILLAWLLAPWGVRLLFERGAFSSADAVRVVEVLRYGLVQVPFYLAAQVYVQIFASLRRYNVLLWSGVIAIFSKLLVNWLMMPFLGISGIMLGTASMYILNLLYFNYVNVFFVVSGGGHEKIN